MNESTVDIILVIVTGAIAWHGITFRDKEGESEWVHLFFGCIAAFYCIWVLFFHILQVA